MKNFKTIIFSLALLSAVGCSIKTDSNSDTKNGKEYTSAYVCPMHCEGSGSETPGQCPVCGMDYEKNEATHK